jgi:hypothetical protein
MAIWYPSSLRHRAGVWHFLLKPHQARSPAAGATAAAALAAQQQLRPCCCPPDLTSTVGPALLCITHASNTVTFTLADGTQSSGLHVGLHCSVT